MNKPEPGELHAVPPDFQKPGIDPLPEKCKRKILAVLDRLIASHEFYCEEILEAIKAEPGLATHFRAQHTHFVDRMRTLSWLHGILSKRKSLESVEAEKEGPLGD